MDNHINKLKKTMIVSGILLCIAIGFLIIGFFILKDRFLTNIALSNIILISSFILILIYLKTKKLLH